MKHLDLYDIFAIVEALMGVAMLGAVAYGMWCLR